ncbi:MAG TPA: hypothetical protein VGB55_12640, partial [Tepidisphaeraceae bacterium]
MRANPAATGLRSLGKRSGATGILIPLRPYPWKSRVAVPAAVVIAILAATGWSSRESLLPATEVRVVPAVLRAVSQTELAATAQGAAQKAAPGSVIAQAAGWVEPDPYVVGVSALTDGVVREVLVLEGQRISIGDVVARLIDDDAKISVQKAEA